MLLHFPKKHNLYADLLSADEFYSPIHAIMDSRLAEFGFVRQKQGVWVREMCSSARPMFELWHFKGAVSAPAWGFALNYVPHFNNSCTKLYWHRTVKSAKLDVFPFDEFDRIQDLTRFATPQDHAIAVKQVLGDALDRAMEFFAEYQTTDDLLPLFERLRCYEGEGLGYWNYSNMPVAHAFTLRVCGDHVGGRSILDEYARRMEISGPPLVDLLNRFERATANSALL